MQTVRLTKAQIAPVKAAMLEKWQDGKCPLCKRRITLAQACMDHNHSTGHVRGILCRNCNGIEGKIKNLVVRGRAGLTMDQYLQSIIDYWVHHEQRPTGIFHPLHKTDEERRVARNTKARKKRAALKKGK